MDSPVSASLSESPPEEDLWSPPTCSPLYPFAIWCKLAWCSVMSSAQAAHNVSTTAAIMPNTAQQPRAHNDCTSPRRTGLPSPLCLEDEPLMISRLNSRHQLTFEYHCAMVYESELVTAGRLPLYPPAAQSSSPAGPRRTQEDLAT